MKSNLKPNLVGFIFGLLVVLAFNMVGAQTPDMNLPEDLPVEMEKTYLEQLAAHHLAALNVAELARQQAEHPEIRQLAERIMQKQSVEIKSINDLYVSWYGGSDVTQTDPDSLENEYQNPPSTGTSTATSTATSTSMLDRLRSSEPFDKAFIETMIPHHQMGILMSQLILIAHPKPEVRQLAEEVIKSNSEEIDQLRALQKSWYGNMPIGSK